MRKTTRKTKKVLALLAAAAAVVSMGACGFDSSSDALTISWWGNQQRNDRTSEINDMFAEQNDGVTIDGQYAEYSDYFQRLSTEAAGGSLPDIMQMDYSYLNQFIENDLLYDMTEFIEDGTIDMTNVDDDIVAAGQQDGVTYAVVNATNAPALIYNKTLTDSLGIEIPDDWTIDEFMDICREIYEASGYKTNFRYYEPAEMMEYMLRADGTVLFEDGGLGVDSADELEEFFEVFETGIEEGWHLEPEVFADLTISSVEQDPLVYGSSEERMSWCTFKFSSQLGAYQSAAGDDVELALAPWPSDDVATSNYIKPSQYWVISKDCENPELAAQWINFYINDVDANKVLLTDRGLPVSTVIIEEIADDLEDADLAAIDYIQNVVTPASTTINPAWPSSTSEIGSTTLPTIEEDLCYGNITASEAAQEFFEQANEIMAD